MINLYLYLLGLLSQNRYKPCWVCVMFNMALYFLYEDRMKLGIKQM